MAIASLPEYLLLHLDRSLPTPLNRQLYETARTAILSHLLPAGLRLPSSRDLARELGVARNTVSYAYDQLLAEGYLETRVGAGTFVADTTPDQVADIPPAIATITASGAAALSARGLMLTRQAGYSDVQWGAFMPGVPDVAAFPFKIWNRLQNKHWRKPAPASLVYEPSGAGHAPLREAIAEHLRVARSVNCSADQVLITSGTHQSLDIVVKLLGEHGDTAWIEDPCYWGTRSTLAALGIASLPVAVDAEGMHPTAAQLRRPPRFICTTPSHQYPLGVVMSLSRRRQLLEYAAAHRSWIIEDDYDSEFRYTSRPLASLQGMDAQQCVLYMGTFSKTLFPGLRIGYLVVPKPLARAFAAGIAELYRGGQVFLQSVLAEFMAGGHYAAHIRRMRLRYRERLRLLQQAVQRHLGEDTPMSGGEAGLHLVLALPYGCDDGKVTEEARAAGVIVRPLSRYYRHPEQAPRGLLLGYANVPDEQIDAMFARLAAVIRRHV